MEDKKTVTDKLRRAGERFRENGLRWTLGHYLKRVGARAVLFYYMKENLPAKIPAGPTGLGIAQLPCSSRQDAASPQWSVPPDGFEFSTFCLDEVTAISCIPERSDYVYEKYVVDNFHKGDICLGLKYQGRIAAFTWFGLDKCHSKFYPASLRSNEAYLYDMYVLKAFRGRNLAPVLRYKNYEVLRDMGRDTFYSITERSNAASFRFKQKLGAEVVLLGLYVELFNKFRKTWMLKRYA